MVQCGTLVVSESASPPDDGDSPQPPEDQSARERVMQFVRENPKLAAGAGGAALLLVAGGSEPARRRFRRLPRLSR